MNETPRDHTATVSRLKGLVPVTEAGREFLAIADELRGIAGLVESMLAAGGGDVTDPEKRKNLEETGLIIGSMVFDGQMRAVSAKYHHMLEMVAVSKGIPIPRK